MSKANVLLIDDDDIDREAIRRAFREIGITPDIVEAGDGEEALAILRGADGYPKAPASPFIILLDINMPRMDGIEFLSVLRSPDNPPAMRNAIVFMLTTSQAQQDRARAYAHNVAGYLVKSNYADGLLEVVRMLKSYGDVVEFPEWQ